VAPRMLSLLVLSLLDERSRRVSVVAYASIELVKSLNRNRI
jgi:hypothetical protein